jgi:uncharacterized protein YlxW (UPF0749 family)
MDLRRKLATNRAIHIDRARIHWLFTLAAVCLVMGALLAVQVRSRPSTDMDLLRGRLTNTGGPVNDLIIRITALQKQDAAKANEILSLHKEIGDYQQAIAKEKDIAKPIVDQLNDDRINLGMTALRGPGVELTLDDSTTVLDSNTLPEIKSRFILHDFDLLQIVNELWSAGAEAIALKNQRIVGGTAIRCVGSTTQVNYVPISPPYRIVALGDPETLSNALNMPGGVLENLRTLKFRIRLEQKQDLMVPPIITARKMKLAKPVEAPEVKANPAS